MAAICWLPVAECRLPAADYPLLAAAAAYWLLCTLNRFSSGFVSLIMSSIWSASFLYTTKSYLCIDLNGELKFCCGSAAAQGQILLTSFEVMLRETLGLSRQVSRKLAAHIVSCRNVPNVSARLTAWTPKPRNKFSDSHWSPETILLSLKLYQ